MKLDNWERINKKLAQVYADLNETYTALTSGRVIDFEKMVELCGGHLPNIEVIENDFRFNVEIKSIENGVMMEKEEDGFVDFVDISDVEGMLDLIYRIEEYFAEMKDEIEESIVN